MVYSLHEHSTWEKAAKECQREAHQSEVEKGMYISTNGIEQGLTYSLVQLLGVGSYALVSEYTT